MRVLMVTPGTRGDVAPMAGLGKKLQEHGFAVSIAANAAHAPLITAAGCNYHELPGDMSALVSPAAPGAKPSASQLSWYMRELGAYFDSAATGTLEAAEQGADVIIANSVAPYAYDVAEAFGIPVIGAHLQPNEPSAAYAPMVLGTARSFGALGNKALGSLIGSGKAPYDAPVARIRAGLGLPKRTRASGERQRRRANAPVLHGFSSSIVPRPADWRSGLSNCGYWWPASDEAWTPPSALADFLAEGPAPVFIGFGSTEALDPEFMLDVARRSGRRAILQGALEISEPGILGIGAAPHQWLFPQMAAVIHHAGAGTTAAGLRAGVPTIAVPIFTDQPFWAARVHALGAGVEPVKYKDLSVDRLTAAIEQTLSTDHYAANASRIARLLAEEEDSSLPVARALREAAAAR
ncbi:glucosyl transferase [Arthrobacter sp. MYb224]|uniref:glycosyltransferase n=1 Tax=Arthrobacter sp. MYb224 TaxID=1848600 RepID=UPI000CFDC51D|nr:glycosyltransferase [Arthrobacter sp. MYb224]PRA00982.1 glucosyl transferase [Arthrobacter sp. MYb224]